MCLLYNDKEVLSDRKMILQIDVNTCPAFEQIMLHVEGSGQRFSTSKEVCIMFFAFEPKKMFDNNIILEYHLSGIQECPLLQNEI